MEIETNPGVSLTRPPSPLQGYEVVGVFMRNRDGRDEAGEEVCTADVDFDDARKVGRHLGIPVETVSSYNEPSR